MIMELVLAMEELVLVGVMGGCWCWRRWCWWG